MEAGRKRQGGERREKEKSRGGGGGGAGGQTGSQIFIDNKTVNAKIVG